MTCERIPIPGGGVAIACSRSKRWPTCSSCGTRNSATKLCDGPARGKSGTCDAKLCAGCATHVGPDRDLCPSCAIYDDAKPSG